MRKYFAILVSTAILFGLAWRFALGQSPPIVQWQAVLSTINQIQAALANTLHSPMSGPLDMSSNAVKNVPCPNLTGEPETEGCAQGTVSPAAATFTSVNGVVTALLTCDGSTSQDTALQAAITAAERIPGTGTGIVQIPASCNGTSGHQLSIASTVTIPDNICIVGSAGPAYAGQTNSVEIDYSGSGIALSSTNTKGSCIKNLRIKNTGTGTTGLDLAGTFQGVVDGVDVEGFGTNGILVEDSSAASSNYNSIVNTTAYHNVTNLYLDQHNSNKSVNSNYFANDHFITATANGGENIRFTGSANENVFDGVDFSGTGSGAGTNLTGVLVDAASGRDTLMNGVTAEGLGTVFNLGANVINFTANNIDGGFFNNTNGTPITANPSASWRICWGVYGNQASECDQSPNFVNRIGYAEINGYQDPTGQVGAGLIQNLDLQSQAIDNASWTKVNAPAQTVGTGATAPDGTTTANTITLNGTGTNALIRQSVSNGGSIQNICFTQSEWFKIDGSSSGTLPAYWEMHVEDSGAANGATVTYPLTTSWQRGTVTDCFPGSVATSVLSYAVYTPAAQNGASQNGVIVDVWGVSLKKTNGAGPYIKTVASAISSAGVGSINSSFVTGLTPGISGGGTLATGSNSFSGTITGSAATGNVLTPGRECPNATVCILSDETTLGGAKITAVSTTSCTYSSTASDTVDYQASCR